MRIIPAGQQHQPMLEQDAQQFGIHFTEDACQVLGLPLIHLPLHFPQFPHQFNRPARSPPHPSTASESRPLLGSSAPGVSRQNSPYPRSTRLLSPVGGAAKGSCSHGGVRLGAEDPTVSPRSARAASSALPPPSSRWPLRCRPGSRASSAPDHRLSGSSCHPRCKP